MQYCQGGKKSKRFSPGSDFTEQIFTGELSRGDSAVLLRQVVLVWSMTIQLIGKEDLKLKIIIVYGEISFLELLKG